MAWWTKANGGKVEEHKTKLDAEVRLNFAKNAGGEPLESLGLYKRNPEKYPDEPNLLPAMIEKHRTKELAKQLREMMKKPRKNS